MAKSNGGEFLTHITGVRMRINGSGTLKTRLITYDDVSNYVMPELTMISATNIQPTVLANFIDQRMQIEVRTTAIDETFNIYRLIPFVRPIATSYPQ